MRASHCHQLWHANPVTEDVDDVNFGSRQRGRDMPSLYPSRGSIASGAILLTPPGNVHTIEELPQGLVQHRMARDPALLIARSIKAHGCA